MQQLEMLNVTLNIFKPAVTETLQLCGTYETLGLVTEQHPKYSETIVYRLCHPGTLLHKTIHRWKSPLKGSIIQLVDDISITDTDQQLRQVLNEKRQKGQTQVRIQFARPHRWNSMTGEGLPTLHFDQLNVIAHHLHHITTGEYLWIDKTNWPPIDEATITLAIMKARTCHPQDHSTQSHAVGQLAQISLYYSGRRKNKSHLKTFPMPATQVTHSVSPLVASNSMSTDTSSWDDDAHNTSALSNASRLSLTPLTESFVNFFCFNTSV
jgi:hypothetical protein